MKVCLGRGLAAISVLAAIGLTIHCGSAPSEDDSAAVGQAQTVPPHAEAGAVIEGGQTSDCNAQTVGSTKTVTKSVDGRVNCAGMTCSGEATSQAFTGTKRNTEVYECAWVMNGGDAGGRFDWYFTCKFGFDNTPMECLVKTAACPCSTDSQLIADARFRTETWNTCQAEGAAKSAVSNVTASPAYKSALAANDDARARALAALENARTAVASASTAPTVDCDGGRDADASSAQPKP